MPESNNEKLSHLNDLLNVARQDGNVHQIELAFIKKIAEMIGVNDADFERVKNGEIKFDPPTGQLDRLSEFHRIVLLAGADRIFTDEEEYIVKELGLKLGMNPLGVNEVIIEMRKHEGKPIMPETFLQIFWKYDN